MQQSANVTPRIESAILIVGADARRRTRGRRCPSRNASATVGGVRVEIDAGVAVVTIDRPEVRNAIGVRDRRRARRARSTRCWQSDAAVLVLRGGGDRAFVSGGDLKELSAIRTHDDAVAMASRVRRVLDRVAAFPVPVIAALNGHALGGGAEVAIAADIRIAADDVKIGFNQVTLGIMPAWGGAERLAQTIGRSRALLAIATGELYDAADARSGCGLVDVVVPRADFDDEWRALAQPAGGARRPGTTRAVKAVIARRVPAVHPELEDDATDAFAGCGPPTRTGTRSRRWSRNGRSDARRVGCSDPIEVEHPDRVPAQHLVALLVGERRGHPLRLLTRERPRRVGVRVVGLEADVVLADRVDRRQAVDVVREAPEDPAVVVGGRRLGDLLLGVRPVRVVLPRVVGPFEGVRDPTDLAFGVRQLRAPGSARARRRTRSRPATPSSC